jgi:hypothetical protein
VKTLLFGQEMDDFEIFQQLKWNKGGRGGGGYVSPISVHQNASEIPSVPELISLPTRFYFRTETSNVPVYGSNLPFEKPTIEKVNFLTKSSPNSSNHILKNLASIPVRKSRTRTQQDIHLPPDFPSYCQYLKGNREKS